MKRKRIQRTAEFGARVAAESTKGEKGIRKIDQDNEIKP